MLPYLEENKAAVEYFRLTHTAGLFSAVFIARDVTQARGPLINNFHSLSDISSEKHYHLAKMPPLEGACACVCVCFRSMRMNLLFSPKLLMGLMRETSTSMCVP